MSLKFTVVGNPGGGGLDSLGFGPNPFERGTWG
jgi:hypothetical protein